MISLRQNQELSPTRLKNIARRATAESFAKAINSRISVVYTEGKSLVKIQPNGVKVILSNIKQEKIIKGNRFKLK